MELTILGCNSATPTTVRNPSAQVLNVGGHLMLIDCGEGTQFQLRKMHINFMRIDHIFISHLHGDHVFGLIGLLSTMSLHNRSTQLTIFAPPELETSLRPQIELYCDNISFGLTFRHLRFDRPEVLGEVKHCHVRSIPLRHRVPTCGFLFRELPKTPNLRKDAIYKYGLTIADIVSIKDGHPYQTPEGEPVPRKELVTEAAPPVSYAYLSDTACLPALANEVRGVDVLFHEATFLSDLEDLAQKTLHSTARQAAEVAKAAGAKKLLLGHFSSRYEDTAPFEQEAATIFPEVTAVYDGYKLVF